MKEQHLMQRQSTCLACAGIWAPSPALRKQWRCCHHHYYQSFWTLWCDRVSGVKKQSLWRVVCASSDMFSDFLQGPITLVGPLVKAIAFLLRCQIYSGLSAFQSPTTLPGMGCWLMFQVCLRWHFLSGPCTRKLVSALKLNSRSMCWTVHFTLNKGWTELLKVIYFETAGP